MIAGDDLNQAYQKARDFAALSVEFDPMEAVRQAFGEGQYSPPLAARVMAMLRADCTDAADGKRWIMRQSPRDRTLSTLQERGGQKSAGTAEFATVAGDDLIAVNMRDILFANDTATAARIDTLLASKDQDVSQLSAMAKAVELAGGTNKAAYDRLPALHGKLNRALAVAQIEQQLEQGYYGNEALRERLAAWVDQPPTESFARAIYISGLPGVGKSFLLTKILAEAQERSNPIALTLDFDRRILNVVEPETLAMELSRQLGNALPDQAAMQADLRARLSGEQAQEGTKRRGTTPYALLEAMGAAVRGSGRKVLLVLDTLEVLASFGASHPARLFEFLDDVIAAGVSPMAIVAAGRGEALHSLGKKRLHRVEPLRGLPQRVARKVLSDLQTPTDAVEPIMELAQGNPLLLRLGAKLVSSGGRGALESRDLAGEAPELRGAYLYRAILSRIDDDRLAHIASLGLVLARVNAKAIQRVIAPACGYSLSDEEASAMLSGLSTQYWLVGAEGDWLRHRADLRAIILPLLRKDQTDQVAAIHAAAAMFFADIDPVEALYHHLHVVPDGMPDIPIDPKVAAQFTQTMIDELPMWAADAIYLARGERSKSFSEFDAAASVAGQAEPPKPRKAPPTATLLADLRLMLERGDVVEANRLFAAHFDADVDPQTPAGIATLCLLWMSGRWSKAEKLYRLLERAEFRHQPWEGADYLVHFTLLEMRAEFGFDALVHEFEHNEDALRRAQYSYRDAKAMRLFEGALAFALLAEQRPYTISGGWREAVGASGTGLNDPSIDEFAMGSVRTIREQFGLPLDFDDTAPWDVAAAMNPYAGPAGSLLTAGNSRTMLSYVVQLGRAASAVLDFPFAVKQGTAAGERLVSGMLNKGPEIIAHLGALGMTADWLSAFTFFYPVADAPTVARRAEAWRRTAAGEWVYGANPPQGWHPLKDGLDRGAAQWLDQLVARRDAADEAARQILFWLRPRYDKDQRREGPVPMGRRAEGRLLKAIAAAHRAAHDAPTDRPRAALRTVMAHGIGRSIAVPVAVLASQKRMHITETGWLAMLASSGSGALRAALKEE